MPDEVAPYLPLVAGKELVDRSPALAEYPAAALITTLPPVPEEDEE